MSVKQRTVYSLDVLKTLSTDFSIRQWKCLTPQRWFPSTLCFSLPVPLLQVSHFRVLSMNRGFTLFILWSSLLVEENYVFDFISIKFNTNYFSNDKPCLAYALLHCLTRFFEHPHHLLTHVFTVEVPRQQLDKVILWAKCSLPDISLYLSGHQAFDMLNKESR